MMKLADNEAPGTGRRGMSAPSYTRRTREALNNSSMNDQNKNNSKCDFDLFFIFNNLLVNENGGTSLRRRTPEFFRGSLGNENVFNFKSIKDPMMHWGPIFICQP
jgi:hypothetical protein